MIRLFLVVAAVFATSSMALAMQRVPKTGLDIRVLRDERISTNRVAVVLKDILYCYPPTKELIVVPRGYVTDFASVPDVATPVVERYGANIDAAIVHDWLYAVGERGKREKADEIFRYALMEQGVGATKRYLAFKAVRLFGGSSYDRPGEWDRRFYNLETAEHRTASPYARRKTAIVGVASDCAVMEDRSEVTRLINRYGSANWAPAATRP